MTHKPTFQGPIRIPFAG